MTDVRIFSLHRLIVAGVMLCSAVSLLATGNVYAAEAEGQGREEITLSPTTKRHMLEPGENTTDSFKVVNTGTVPLDFLVYARPYSVEDRTYAPNFSDVDDERRANAYAWVQFEQTEYSIEPGQSATVRYSLAVPDDAIPGGQYGVLFAETIPDNNQQDSVVRKKRVGSILQVSVAGDVVEQGKVLNTSVPAFQFSPPLTTTTSVENTGTVDFESAVTLTAKDVFGNIKYSEKRDFTVYPDTIRDIAFDWDDANWFGIYHVELSAVAQDNEVVESQYVLMAPRWLLIVLVVGLLGGGYATFRRRS